MLWRIVSLSWTKAGLLRGPRPLLVFVPEVQICGNAAVRNSRSWGIVPVSEAHLARKQRTRATQLLRREMGVFAIWRQLPRWSMLGGGGGRIDKWVYTSCFKKGREGFEQNTHQQHRPQGSSCGIINQPQQYHHQDISSRVSEAAVSRRKQLLVAAIERHTAQQ